jgi:hypothetical protein
VEGKPHFPERERKKIREASNHTLVFCLKWYHVLQVTSCLQCFSDVLGHNYSQQVKKPDISSAIEHKGKEAVNVELMGLEHKTAFEERKDSSDSETKYPANTETNGLVEDFQYLKVLFLISETRTQIWTEANGFPVECRMLLPDTNSYIEKINLCLDTFFGRTSHLEFIKIFILF